MLSPYRSVLSRRGAFGFVTAGLVGRFPLSMLGLGALLLVTTSGGSYAVGGALTATIAIATSIGAPPTGRLADRFGQHRLLPPSLLLFGAGVAGTVVAVLHHAPTWTFFPPAIVAGVAVPQIGSMVRARWVRLVGGTPELNTAFALESGLDEVVFVVGPVIATVLATQVWPAGGVVTAAGLAMIGGMALALQRSTEPPPSRHSTDAHPAAISVPGLRVLVATFVAVGGIFGTMDVAVVGFAQEHGHRGLAGVVLGVFALGSLIASVVYGSMHWRAPLHRRFSIAVAGLFLGTVPIMLAPSIPVLAGTALVAGLAISPSIIAGMGLVEALVPPGALTEGFSWVITAIGVGVAIGSSVSGVVVDAAGGHRALLTSVACGVVATSVAWLFRSRLHTDVGRATPVRRAASC